MFLLLAGCVLLFDSIYALYIGPFNMGHFILTRKTFGRFKLFDQIVKVSVVARFRGGEQLNHYNTYHKVKIRSNLILIHSVASINSHLSCAHLVPNADNYRLIA